MESNIIPLHLTEATVIQMIIAGSALLLGALTWISKICLDILKHAKGTNNAVNNQDKKDNLGRTRDYVPLIDHVILIRETLTEIKHEIKDNSEFRLSFRDSPWNTGAKVDKFVKADDEVKKHLLLNQKDMGDQIRNQSNILEQHSQTLKDINYHIEKQDDVLKDHSKSLGQICNQIEASACVPEGFKTKPLKTCPENGTVQKK